MTTTYPPMPEPFEPGPLALGIHNHLHLLKCRCETTDAAGLVRCDWQQEGRAGDMLRFSLRPEWQAEAAAAAEPSPIAMVVDHNGEFGIGLYDSWQAYCEAGTLPGPERWISLDVPFDYPNLVAAICIAWVTGS